LGFIPWDCEDQERYPLFWTLMCDFRDSKLVPSLLVHTSMAMAIFNSKVLPGFPLHRMWTPNSCQNLALTWFSNLQVSCLPVKQNNC
jgi:hypothetical protein